MTSMLPGEARVRTFEANGSVSTIPGRRDKNFRVPQLETDSFWSYNVGVSAAAAVVAKKKRK